MSTLLVTHPSFVEHDTGPGHPERPDRMRAIDKVLAHDLFKDLKREEAPLREDVEARIALAHPASYIDWVKASRPGPGEDPVRLHARLWQVNLRCPDGGEYVWNEEFQTMESTVHGCPARPKTGPATAPALQPVDRLNLGVTFEPQQRGLRARAVLHRPAEQPEPRE